MFFFNLKDLRVIFVLKPGENSFSLWPAHIRFGGAVRVHIVHADFGVGFRGLDVMQVCVVIEFLRNNIACNFNIAFLPNI